VNISQLKLRSEKFDDDDDDDDNNNKNSDFRAFATMKLMFSSLGFMMGL
jgi:hypothetical protein